ncbi:MAG: hypothetical protein LBQ42_00970 [Synergistaceae bacterium]|nr:hypothetical protein [Synergistaceae bacterium]
MKDCEIQKKLNSREGIGLAEALILMIILGVALIAIFSTLEWGSKSYTFARQEMQGRELLFNWVQTFESLWPTSSFPNPDDAFNATAASMGGSWNNANKQARVEGFTIETLTKPVNAGKLPISVRIYVGNSNKGKLVVSMDKSYNIFSNETVSDDSL